MGVEECGLSGYSLQVIAGLNFLSVRVIVIRIPIKQEIVPKEFENEILNETKRNYEMGWNLLKTRMQENESVEFCEPANFNLNDFHEWDKHWNNPGNKKFADFLSSVL